MKKFKTIIMTCFALLIVILPTLLCGCGEAVPTLELKTSFKTEYYIGEKLDTTGGVLAYTNEKGETVEVKIESNMVAGFDSETVGEKTMTIAYNGLSIAIDYEVKSYVDVNLERLYYSNPSVFTGGQEDKYFYIYFDENKQDLYLFMTNVTPQNALTGVDTYIKDDHCKFTYQKNIIDGKAVYNISIETEGYPTTNYTITAKSENIINVSVVQGTITASEDLTMYDGVQYQKLYCSHPSALTQNDPATSYDYVYFASSTEVYVWASMKTPDQVGSSDLAEESKYTYSLTKVEGKEVFTFSTATNNIQIVAKDINTITLTGIGTQISFDLSAYNG